jgi:hypothetical protein
VCVVVPLTALFLLACGEECQEPPGTFEVVEGCVVELEMGEDVYPFCTNRPSGPSGGDCGGPDEAFAQSWLASIQALAGSPDDPRFPIRVGCGPFNPELVVQAQGDCCFLFVYAETTEDSCIDHSFIAQ